ncbi:MAG: hypothetical protein L6V35_04755 [Alistipes putredinis]|nr:MAG: hypothetical protein L6V35_04755 [Alistipes putredinis]
MVSIISMKNCGRYAPRIIAMAISAIALHVYAAFGVSKVLCGCSGCS